MAINFQSYKFHISQTAVFFSPGGWVTLTPLVLVDLLGLDMVSRSLGVLLVFMATGLVLGTPMAGELSWWILLLPLLS